VAAGAQQAWRRVPAPERIQYLFKLKALLEDNFEEISRTITMECGKTLAEAKGEMRRAIENVEVACGIPMMMLGDFSEDIASGIDEMMIRQPVGVCAIIAPFNFPGMIPFWFLPYAIACGNTVIVKPSERVPLTMQKVFPTPSSTIRKFRRLVLLARRPLPATSIAVGRRAASVCRPRVGQRTRLSSFPTPTWR
jgi:malonate-semialdehyde dehydrogenase (acetylating)/methylmalonate-semialdehyde dehydrogenase